MTEADVRACSLPPNPLATDCCGEPVFDGVPLELLKELLLLRLGLRDSEDMSEAVSVVSFSSKLMLLLFLGVVNLSSFSSEIVSGVCGRRGVSSLGLTGVSNRVLFGVLAEVLEEGGRGRSGGLKRGMRNVTGPL